jgi:uncharacterized repeat protein (TIGR03803 family)
MARRARTPLITLLALAAATTLRVLPACGDARPAAKLEVLHAFDGADGAWSRGSLTRVGNVLYGRTAIGGTANSGTVFRIAEDGAFTRLHSFTAGGRNGTGNQPHHNAMLLVGDRLIGAALYGGNERGDVPGRITGDVTSGPPTVQLGNGTLFSIRPDGSGYHVLLELDGGPGAPALPHSSPVLAPDGRTLYGMTSSGGAHGNGTLYAIAADGSGYRLLRSFETRTGDQPHGMVAFDSRGRLLGMTRKGGEPTAGAGVGVIFRFDVASGAYDVLHTFQHGDENNGDTNDHGFLTLVDGVAYATTELGGAAGAGVLFAIREDGSEFRIVHSFGVAAGDGRLPYGSLLLLDGWLYGTTTAGGATGDGTLFRFEIASGAYERLASFDRRTTGAFPEDNLVASADGRALYGLTQAGGAHDPDAKHYAGTVFRFVLP